MNPEIREACERIIAQRHSVVSLLSILADGSEERDATPDSLSDEVIECATTLYQIGEQVGRIRQADPALDRFFAERPVGWDILFGNLVELG